MSKRSPRLVYKHSMVPTKRPLSLSSSRIIGLLRIPRQSHLGVSQFTKIPIACCSCFAIALPLLCSLLCSSLLLCSLLSWSIPREKCLKLIHRFLVSLHSVCASDSMFTITDNCLFLFLFLDRYLNTTRASRPLHLHRSMPLRVHAKSVYVRTKSADSAPDPSSACYHHLVLEWGIHGL